MAVGVQLLATRVTSIDAVTTSPTWNVSFDAVIYALSQVVGGKTILVDIPSQYGLFPEVLGPFFKVIGLSVFTFTATLAVMQVAALCAVAVLLNRHVESGPLKILSFSTLLIATGLFLFLAGYTTELYLQYFPIRFFWPALALLLFSAYATRPRQSLLIILAAVSGLTLFWNIDTGVPTILAIGATLFSKALFQVRPRLRSFLPAAIFFAIALCTFAAALVILRITASGPLQLGSALAYQRIFFGSGFGMLPMPLWIHPWQSVLFIYLAGAVVALTAWKDRVGGTTSDLLFCSSILGLGLFAYYQGRSHIYCLLMVMWPALLIGTILTDRILKLVRLRQVRRSALLAILPLIGFFSLASVTLFSSIPTLLRSAKAAFEAPPDPVIADELAFMRATRANRPCLILSQRQGIYYATLNSASPLDGPGLIETILQRDLDALIVGATTKPLECIYLGIGPASETFIDVRTAALETKYPVAARSPLGTMLLLEPRP